MPIVCAFMRGLRDGLNRSLVDGYGYPNEAARDAADLGLSLGSSIEQKVTTTITRAITWTDRGTQSCTRSEI